MTEKEYNLYKPKYKWGKNNKNIKKKIATTYTMCACAYAIRVIYSKYEKRNKNNKIQIQNVKEKKNKAGKDFARNTMWK